MADIIPLGKLLDPSEFEEYIEESKKLKTVIHKYGTGYDIPEYTCWMEYQNEGNILGSISFTRNTFKNLILANMVSKVQHILTSIFPTSQSPLPERIHLMRTFGSVVKHKDEGGRLCCINIGIKNSSNAKTKVSNDGIYENFERNSTT